MDKLRFIQILLKPCSLIALMASLLITGCAGPQGRLPRAVNPQQATTPYAMDVYADDPVAHWRLDGDAEGPVLGDEGGATRLGPEHRGLALRGADIGGGAFSVELWVQPRRGQALRYVGPDGETPFAFVIGPQGSLVVRLFGQELDTDARLNAERWHHLGLSWRASDGLTLIAIDGHAALRRNIAAGGVLPYDGSLEVRDYLGAVDEVAVFEEFKAASMWLHRVNVARGASSPSTPEELAPVKLLLRDGHAEGVRAARWSPDGATIATISDDQSVRVWDAATGQTLKRFTEHTDRIEAVRWSPDGTKLATVSVDRVVKIWDLEAEVALMTLTAPDQQRYSANPEPLSDASISWNRDGTQIAVVGLKVPGDALLWEVATGQRLHTLSDHADAIWSVEWSPDGATVATTSYDSTTKLWDGATGQLLRTLPGDSFVPAQAHWSPDSLTLALVSEAETKLWEPSSGKLLKTLATDDQAWAWSPDSSTLASYNSERTTTLWEVRTGKILRTIHPPKTAQMLSPPHAGLLTWSPDSQRLAVASSDTDAMVFDVAGDAPPQPLTRHTQTIHSLHFNPEGTTLVTASEDKSAVVWDSRRGVPLQTLTGKTDGGGALTWSPDSRYVAEITHNAAARVWDSATGQALPLLEGHAGRITSLSWSPDGARVVTASRDRTAKLWSATTGQALRTLAGHDGALNDAAWSPDGAHIATASHDKSARIWDATTGALRHTLQGHERPVTTLAWHPAGTHIVTAAAGGASPRLWEVSSGLQTALLEGHTGDVIKLAWSPDGASIASIGSDRDVRIWDASTGQPLHTLKGHTSALNAIAWSPDGAFIATAADCGTGRRRPSTDNLVRLWDTATGEHLVTLDGHERSVYALSWSPDGRQLATVSKDQTTRIWDIPSGRNAHTLRGHQGEVTSAAWSPLGKLATSSLYDKTLRLWNIEAGTNIGLIAAGNVWLTMSGDGYFAGSAEAGELFAVAQGWRVYAYEQLAVTRNRPDELLARLGADEEAIELYQALWMRRLSKLGIAAEDLKEDFTPAPRVRLMQVSEPDDEGFALFEALIKDKNALMGYRVAVNGVPVGSAALNPLEGKRARVRFEVPLTRGRQRIDVTALNARGVESLRASVSVDYEGAELPEPRLFFIGFGVSDYASDELDLNYAHQDTLDLHEALKQASAGFAAVEARIFINDQVDDDALAASAAFLEDITEHDTLIIFVAGHGVRANDKARTYYYLDHDARVEDLEGTAIPFDDVERLLYEATARKKLFLMDTCESGEDLDAIELEAPKGEGAERPGMSARSVRGAKAFGVPASATPDTNRQRMRRMLMAALRERDRLILQDLSRRSGAMVLASSMGSESSLESAGWNNGAFTEALLNALMTDVADINRDGLVSTDELFRHASEAVPALTNDRQHPSLQKDNPLQTFSLPVINAPPETK